MPRMKNATQPSKSQPYKRVSANSVESATAPVPKPRGRPPKIPTDNSSSSSSDHGQAKDFKVSLKEELSKTKDKVCNGGSKQSKLTSLLKPIGQICQPGDKSQSDKTSQQKRVVFTQPNPSRSTHDMNNKRLLGDVAGLNTANTKIRKVDHDKLSSQKLVTVQRKAIKLEPTVKSAMNTAITVIADGSSNVSEAENRSRRSRKPSQKLIEHLEFEKEGLNHTGSLKDPPEKHRPISLQSPLEPVTLSLEKNTQQAQQSHPTTTSSELDKSDDTSKVCCCCGARVTKYQWRYQKVYCNPCVYMYTKFISKNFVQPCVESCNGNNMKSCVGCRAAAMNATLPESKRLKIPIRQIDPQPKQSSCKTLYSPTRTTINHNLSFPNESSHSITIPKAHVKLTGSTLSDLVIGSQKAAGSPRTISHTVKQQNTIKQISNHELDSMKQAAPSSWASELQRIIQMPPKSAAGSVSLLSPAKAGNPSSVQPSFVGIKLSPQKVLLSGKQMTAKHGKDMSSGIVYRIPASVADAAVIRQSNSNSSNVHGTNSIKLHTASSVALSGRQPNITGIQVIKRPAQLSTVPSGSMKILTLSNEKRTPAEVKKYPKVTVEDSEVAIADPAVLTEESTVRVEESTVGEEESTVGKEESTIGVEESTGGEAELTVRVKDSTPELEESEGEMEEAESDLLSELTKLDLPSVSGKERPNSTESISSGPRVKHVSRSVCKAQGIPAIVQPADLRLSALPLDEKSKIWNDISLKDEYSDQDIESSKSAKVQYNWQSDLDLDDDSEDNFRPKAKTAVHRMKIKTNFVSSNYQKATKMGKRKPRCGTCSGCKNTNCKVCVYCKDMKKYGGPGKMKQCCIERRCIHKQVYNYKSYTTDPEKEERRARKRELMEQSLATERRGPRPPKRYRSESPSSADAESGGTQDSVHTADDLPIASRDTFIESDLTNKPLTELLRRSNRLEQSGGVSAPVPVVEEEDLTLEQGRMSTDGTLVPDQSPGFSLVEASHRLMADFIDTYDIDKVWEQGVAIVSSYPQSTRVLCYLCGSGGLHQFCYCAVCCEPFHYFCLEECDRPKTLDSKVWICRKCRFCQVCGKLNNLLTCDRCTKTYHAECLGDGYTIKPTSAGVWVCNSCVKCTSCGATTPGGPKDKWNSDFSLCASCEALKLKGNFCPICSLCYSDDDWDCKMIGCSTCDSWTHSKCENLPDDLYELIGYIDDDEAQYECRTCVIKSKKQVSGKPDWLVALEQLRLKGFSIICASILDKKYAQSVAKVDEEELRNFYEQYKAELLSIEQRSRSQSPSKTRSPTKASPSASKERAREPDATADDKDDVSNSCKELCVRLKDCSSPFQSAPTPAPVRRRGRPRKHPVSPDKITANAATESDTASSSVEPAESTTRAGRSKSRTESTDTGTPKRGHRQLQSPTHKTPEGESSQGGKQSKASEKPLKRPKREKQTKEDEDKDVTTMTPSASVDANQDSKPSIQDTDFDTSFSSLPDNAVYNLASADLRERFKDVEWESPAMTFESLKGTGYPLDISSIQTNISNYTSINNFIDDVVRVLQGALTRGRILGTKYLRQALATKKLFEQEVEQLFPWCEVDKSGLWEYNLSMPKGMMKQARLPPSSEHDYARWLKKPEQQEDIEQPSPYKHAPPSEAHSQTVPFNLPLETGELDIPPPVLSWMDNDGTAPLSALDNRKCQLCSISGDDFSNNSGRLLYCGADDWVHVNCAFWSAEVFEEADGTLQKVHAAIGRGKMLNCSLCSNRGATVGCCTENCKANFHFMCARTSDCTFLEDKQVFCSSCKDSVNRTDIQTEFAVLRTVTVNYAHAKIKKPWQRGFKPSDITVIAGSLTVENLGYVLPESDYLDLLVPINYRVSRVYWSTQTPYKRCVYTCKIVKVDAGLDKEKPSEIVPDITICHDYKLPGYTPFAILTKKYPEIFTEKNVEVLRKAAMDYDEQPADWDSEDEELSNLTGIASALNKAAHRSQRKRRHKGQKKASILYGSSAPELSGNLDDHVAEMLDMVTEEGQDVLGESKVIILRDVDDTVAQDVVEVLGQMSEAEAEERGGVQAVMQTILDKHGLGETEELSVESENARREKENASQNIDLKEAKKMAVSIEMENGSTTHSGAAAKLVEDEKSQSPVRGKTQQQGRPNSVISQASSLEAYSTGSSCDNSFTGTDNEDGPEPIADPTNDADTAGTPLLSPPKIIITDFSYDVPTDIAVDDPFAGVKQTPTGVSHCTKDRLKSLVRKRSESLSDPTLPPQGEDVESKVVKKQSSSGVLSGDMPNVLTACPPFSAANNENHIASSEITKTCKDDLHRNKESQEEHLAAIEPMQSQSESTLTKVERTNISAEADMRQSFNKETLCTSTSSERVKLSHKKRCLGPKSSKLRQLAKLSLDPDSQFDLEPDNESDAESYSPASPSRNKSQDMNFSGKANFANSFCQPDDDFFPDLSIRVSDQTPKLSESDDEEDSPSNSDDENERIVAPPNITCVLADSSLRLCLPRILNPLVMLERLPQDIEGVDEEDEPSSSTPEPFHKELSPPARDISREVRKDMINYCEDEESESTDEEEVCKPRVNLRHRERVNYNEAAMAADSGESDTPVVKERKRGRPKTLTGKVLVDSKGSVQVHAENIPSALQKTISDAIRKAHNKETVPAVTSANQAYAGSAQTGSYNLRANASGSSSLVAERAELTADSREQGLRQDECNFAAPAAIRRTVLPHAAVEEEIIEHHQSQDDTLSLNCESPSSTFLAFEISSDDGFKVRADNWNDAWQHVTDAVRELRMSSGCPAISYAGVNGLSMFGLQHTSIAYFTEQLYGARYCRSYRFTFHHPPMCNYEEEQQETATGCCRSEPYSGRKPTDMFSFIDSRYRKKPVGLQSSAAAQRDENLTQTSSRRPTSLDLPMAMRFRHLKTYAKQATAVYRSPIHGRGLFCQRQIDSGEMIIEYAGEVIKHYLSDARERRYEKKGIGCYMFKMDDLFIVDATMKGNAARFINHSCDPNCYSKIIDVNGSRHIVIFSLRTIQRGEELTYDYKFPYEEVKITCKCGAKKCRGFLN